ncbi:MAG: Asp-tRNA(Asn)/Glu-tRNA(Gln) amidotransferase GatCAB subunit B, partial [Clostridia bacterium]
MMYDAVIGLEVHAELNTKTKMYCACENRFGGDTNSRICPICAGMPGAMPALNREAVVMAISAGLMMGCEINRVTRMCRKHYFYPDLPKGYQISQYKDPLCVNGSFDYFSDNTVKTAYIRQIHIEEDAGKLTHGDVTAVDLNRCGVPLIEIVTQPCFNSAIDAYSFLTSVRTMLLYLGISDCAMQEGSLRCDVNVSLRPHGVPELSPRVEMKNVSTFTGARRAIE